MGVEEMGMLAGKVAVVTGGNSGIGLTAAKAFATEGAQVVIIGRRQQALDDAVEQIGRGAMAIQADVTDPSHHDRIAQEVRQKFGGLDVYMVNAGIATIRVTEEVSEAEFDLQFAINTRGVFFGVQRMLPIMRDGGAIVLTGSIAS